MPLYKSEEGWRRLRANVRARRGVRGARMDHRPRPKVISKPKAPRPEFEDFDAYLSPVREEENISFQPRLRGRRHVVFE